MKIGWYCPYTIVPLLECKNVSPIAIKRNGNQNISFGQTKLCGTLSAVYKSLQAGCLDGLVLTSCCNLSQYATLFFQQEFPAIPMFFMEMAIKHGPFFQQLLNKNWKDMQLWIDSLKMNDSSFANLNLRNISFG